MDLFWCGDWLILIRIKVALVHFLIFMTRSRIILGVFLLLIIGFVVIVVRGMLSFDNYPMSYIATVQNSSGATFFVNNMPQGTASGACFTLRHEKNTIVSVRQGALRQEMKISDATIDSSSPPTGDSLGLKVTPVNDKPEMRHMFGCQ